MKELKHNEKIAILKVLDDIMKADGIIHDNEKAYIESVQESFGLEDVVKEEVECLTKPEALEILKELDDEQKEMFAMLMGKMIIIDEDINYNEVRIYNHVYKYCQLAKPFDIDEYPDYSLSGPFVNPEEI